MSKSKLVAYFFPIFFILIALHSCTEEIPYTPKPRAFPRILFPEKDYQSFDKDYCSFSFKYPTYAEVIKDTLFFDKRPKNECWFDLQVKDLNATIHCSYISISKKDPLEELVKDAFVLTNKHNVKADYIDEIIIKKPNNVSGYVFDVEGSVASPFQFYLTDSTNHFLRGSLYVKAKSRPDSLAPIYEYLKQDIMHLVNTFEWTE